MKFVHLSDLHLGKRVNEFSMIEDQRYILRVILDILDREQPDGVIIAGDVYDKSVPSAEAVTLFDSFLYSLAERSLQVFVISGNHDSPERIAFAGRITARSGIHLSSVYDGHVEPVTLEDEYGKLDVYLLPFLKPVNVRRFFPDSLIESYTDALRVALEGLPIDPNRRNLLISHQFVTGASRSDSEEVSVGGLDNVDAAVFDPFDYVALGHIHGPQNVGSPRIRYCGTPLKYSFSEVNHKKSVTVVTLAEKGALKVQTIPLMPLRDMREIRGRYMDLTARSFYQGTSRDDYLHVTLTDEEDIPEVIGKLRTIYPNLMKLDYDNLRTRSGGQMEQTEMEQRSPLELFETLYRQQNGQGFSEEQATFVNELIEQIWEGDQ